MKFEDLDDEFNFEKQKHRSKATKIRMATLFVIFLLVIVAIAGNDFNFVFGADNNFNKVCGPGNTYRSRDDSELIMEKSQKALSSNMENFKKIEGFLKAYVKEEPISYKNKTVPVIYVIFSYEDEVQKDIPSSLCNFDVKILYK